MLKASTKVKDGNKNFYSVLYYLQPCEFLHFRMRGSEGTDHKQLANSMIEISANISIVKQIQRNSLPLHVDRYRTRCSNVRDDGSNAKAPKVVSLRRAKVNGRDIGERRKREKR